jgi:hypothetical protein
MRVTILLIMYHHYFGINRENWWFIINFSKFEWFRKYFHISSVKDNCWIFQNLILEEKLWFSQKTYCFCFNVELLVGPKHWSTERQRPYLEYGGWAAMVRMSAPNMRRGVLSIFGHWFCCTKETEMNSSLNYLATVAVRKKLWKQKVPRICMRIMHQCYFFKTCPPSMQ